MKLTLHETPEGFVNEGSHVLQAKGRRASFALRALALAAGAMSVGIVVGAL